MRMKGGVNKGCPSQEQTRCRLAILWPRPRGHRWRLGREHPAVNPDQSDALLNLENEGIQVDIEDSTQFPLNPLARMHEMWSGLDPVRVARVLLHRRRYDLIVGVGDAVAYFLTQVRRLLGLRLPIVLIDPALSYHYPRRKHFQDRILPFVDKVIVYGRVQLDYLREQYGDRVDAVFLPHRMDTAFYCPGDEPASAANGSPSVLSVGGDASRDFDTLLRAVELCRSATQDGFRCLIKTHLPIGETVAGIQVIREPVSWVGLRDLYRKARIVVLPLKDSLHAGGINTLLEAMSVGRPVVVSDSRGIRDYVQHEETALVVPPGSPTAMAQAIRRLLDSPDEARRLGENARQFVVNTSRNSVYAQSLAGILREVMAKRCEDRNRQFRGGRTHSRDVGSRSHVETVREN